MSRTKQDRLDWIENKVDEYMEAVENLPFNLKSDIDEEVYAAAEDAWNNMMADIGDQMMEERRDREMGL